MKIFLILSFLMAAIPVHADVFKPDEKALTSIFSNPYHFQYETVHRKSSRRLDPDKAIAHQIKTMLSKNDVNSLIGSVNTSRLMLWQYSSPAAADLFKHFHTIAYLRTGMLYDDLLGLEKGLQVDMDYLRDQSEMECIEDKLAAGSYEGDIVDVMLSCRDTRFGSSGAFASLNYPAGSKVIDVFEKILNRQNVRGARKVAILEILPKWQITPDGFEIEGPLKRIGQVLSDNRLKFKQQLDDALAEYLRDKMISADVLLSLSLPELPFTEQYARDLLMLYPDEKAKAKDHVIEGLANATTLDQYDTAIEWLTRADKHPSLEEAYKNIVRQGIAFLEHEKVTLTGKKIQLNGHQGSVRALNDASEAERSNSIKEEAYGQ